MLHDCGLGFLHRLFQAFIHRRGKKEVRREGRMEGGTEGRRKGGLGLIRHVLRVVRREVATVLITSLAQNQTKRERSLSVVQDNRY